MCVCRWVEERERKRGEFEIRQLVCTAVLFHIKVKLRSHLCATNSPTIQPIFIPNQCYSFWRTRQQAAFLRLIFWKKLTVPVTLFPNSTLYKPQYLTAVFLQLASHKLEMSCCSTLFRLVHTLYMLQHFNFSGFPLKQLMWECVLFPFWACYPDLPLSTWHNFLSIWKLLAVPGKFEEAYLPPTFLPCTVQSPRTLLSDNKHFLRAPKLKS